ncbi:MAG: hypothetical protein JRN15_16525 [Nitrososphaerota archaeon]|nr:hypothetical protein [Nitrososphaerota archaeon]
MAELTERVKEPDPSIASRREFSYLIGGLRATPWEAAFSSSDPLGYWQAFARRCSKLGRDGVVEEQVAREVWLSILRDYEDYEKLGMWIPEDALLEHRSVAQALGWI